MKRARLTITVAGVFYATALRASAQPVIHDRCARFGIAFAARERGEVEKGGALFANIVAERCALRRITLTVWLPDRTSRAMALPVIPPNSSYGVRVPAPRGEAQPAAELTFHVGRTVHTLQAVVPPVAEPQATINPTVIVAGLGVFGTLAALLTSEGFALRRERRAAASARSALMFEKYEGAFRNFLAAWPGTPNPGTLETAFQRLQSSAILPPKLLDRYAETRAALSESDPSRRKSAAKAFYSEVAAMLMDPTALTESRRHRR